MKIYSYAALLLIGLGLEAHPQGITNGTDYEITVKALDLPPSGFGVIGDKMTDLKIPAGQTGFVQTSSDVNLAGIKSVTDARGRDYFSPPDYSRIQPSIPIPLTVGAGFKLCVDGSTSSAYTQPWLFYCNGIAPTPVSDSSPQTTTYIDKK